MSVLYSDTHPEMEALQIQLLRQAGEAELRRRLAGLLLGEELARKVYGDINHAA